MNTLLLSLIFLCCAMVIAPAHSETGTPTAPVPSPVYRYIHNGPESLDDKRYTYHWRVLRAALDANKEEYGAYEIGFSSFMNESRQLTEMKRRDGRINTMALDTTTTLEKQLIPVKIPVDKGLLGYRVLLIRHEMAKRFAAVRTANDLRRFSFGQGFDWSDVAIFKAAQLPVVTASNYESLFGMLMAGRFDALGRGVSEVMPELAQRQFKYPEMEIESSLLLYYPMPVYFWFSSDENGIKRARRVEDGMSRIIANGTLDKLFYEEFDDVINRLKLKQRRIIRFDNPTLPPDQPFDKALYWYKAAH